MGTGWLGHQFTRLTNRDVLIALALSFPSAVRSANEDDGAMVKPTIILIGELCALCDRTVLAEIGYGLPKPLVERLVLSVGEFITNRSNSTWLELHTQLESNAYLGELEDLWPTLEDLPTDTTRFLTAFRTNALAAATTLTSRQVRSWADDRARRATVLDWEVVSRLRRLDFVVLHPELTDTGLVLGADVGLEWDGVANRVAVDLISSPQITRQLGHRNWRVAHESFEAGLEVGRRAAVQLLKSRGFSVRALSALIELRGPFPPELVRSGSAGLPLALRILADKCELSTFGYLATGALDPDTLNLEPLSAEDVLRKHKAMTADGVNHTLLAYAPDEAEKLTVPGIRLIPGPTLEDAARAVWGTRWDQWVSDRQARRLRELGFERGWVDGVWAGGLNIEGHVVVVPVPQVGELLTHFNKAPGGITAFLGGPSQSGKTWIAQQLVAKAVERNWHTVVLTPLIGVVPRVEELCAAIELCLRADKSRPTLVILDDLEWDVTLENFEDELATIADDLHINVLAVARSGLETEWHANEGLTAVAGARRTLDFAQRLVSDKAFGSARKRLEPLAGKIAQDSGGDLSWLVRLAQIAYQGDEYTASVQRYILPKIQLLSSSERQSAQALASLAYVGLDAPEWFVPLGDRLGDLGVRRRRDSRWMLPSRAVATALLSQNVSARTEAARNLSRFVAEAMHHDDFEVMRVVVRLSREAPEILAMICHEHRADLDRWMNVVLRPERLGRVLNALKEHIQPEDRGKWALKLIRKLQRQLPDIRVADLAVSLDLLQAHLFAVEKQEGGHADWKALITRLELDLQKILLKDRADSSSRLELLRTLWRLHEDVIYNAIRDNAEHFLAFQSPFTFADYQLALEFGEINRKLPPSIDLSLLPGVQALLVAKLQEATADVYAAQLVFQSSVERLEWTSEVFPRAVRQLPGIIAKSSPRQICRAMLILGKFDRALAAGLFTFDRNRLGSTLSGAFSRFRSAGDMADLIDRVLVAHGHTARRLLYEEVQGLEFGTRAKASALHAAFRAITERGDGKGAGRLLKAAFRIDANFASITDGFGRQLAERLGRSFFLNQCEWEPRTSVLYHLLEGLIAIDAPFLEDVLDAAMDSIERQIELTMRPWAPRLALLLADTTAVGQRLSGELARRLRSDRLLACMTESPTAESLELFHRLGTYLHQEELPYRFARHFEKDASPVLRTLDSGHRPEVVIRAARTIRNTLRRAGEQDSGLLAISGFDRNWPKWLKTARTDGDLAEAIRGLTSLDAKVAEDAVRASERDLLVRTQDAVRRHPQVGAALLDAIEDAAPGAGKSIVGKMIQTRYAWTAAMRQIAHAQDPREQGTIFSMLAALGGVPSTDDMDNVFGRWRNDIKNIANPPGIVVLLRAFAAWDLTRAREMATRVSTERVVARFRAGAKHDLDWSEALIGALWNLELQDVTEPLLDALGSLDPEHFVRILGPSRTARLLICLREWRPGLGRTLANAATELPLRASRNRYISDDGAVVWSLGWLAYALHLYGISVDLGETDIPWVYKVPQEHGILVWGVGWMESRGWVDGLFTRSLSAVLDSKTPVEPKVAAAAIVVAARRGEVVPKVSLLVNRALSGRVPLYLLEALIEAGFRQPNLAAALVTEVLPASVSAPNMRLHPARQRLMQRFDALRGTSLTDANS